MIKDGSGLRHAHTEELHSMKRKDLTCFLIDSDEDNDEITIVNSSFPSKDIKQSKQKGSDSPEKAKKSSTSSQQQPEKSSITNKLSAYHPKMQSILDNTSTNTSMPPIEELRSQFADAVSKSMPALITSLQQQQQFSQPIVAQSTMADTGTTTQMQTQVIRAVAAQPVKWPELKIHDKVLALYREEDKPSSFYAGVIAEAPSAKNNRRFLVFFDDGYAQYCDAKELHKVYMQSENVWEDINPDTSAFIKEYLRIYPERPMVRLSKGQVVRTEWNGKWWTAKVQETDASLVKMYFQADKRTEWIYRGSTRLEPLFKALANADAIKAAGSAKGRRHNLNMRPSDTHTRPSVEYTRGAVDEDSNSSAAVSQKEKSTSKVAQTLPSESAKKKSNVAKKSTGGAPSENVESSKSGRWEAPWLKYQRKAQQGTQRSVSTESNSEESDKSSRKEKKQTNNANPGRSSKDIASVLQERLSTTTQVEYDEELATGERIEKVLEIKGRPRVSFKLHKCSPECIDEKGDLEKFRDQSAFQIPILMGWERQVCKIRPTTKRFIIYRAPCGLRLRTIQEVDKYLYITDSQLSIDLFCFDQQLHVNTEFVAVRTFCDIKDLSYGRENYKVSCVNGVDRHYPDYVEYSNQRLPSKGVSLNLNSDFLICCDCTDNCRDRTKCACQQQTIENTSWIGEIDPKAGYHYRRLPEPLFTGIVECNSRCKCDKRCSNRVAQLGLRMRLQVFKTEKKGWGLRCLDDIAKGSFICIYAGQLLTDKGANEDGKQYGDEYLAELDFIEVVERQKEGYESDVDDMDFSDDENDANYKAEDDSDYTNDDSPPSNGRKTRKRKAENAEADNKKDKKENSKPESSVVETTEDQPISISDDDDDEDEEDPNPKKEEKEKNPENTNSSPDVTKKLRSRAKKSTGGSKFNLSTSLKTSQEVTSEKEESKRVPTRSYFQDDTECYIMDAKLTGNLGRYLNHSCSPNVFVQNIFVDTHDLRFPWVAFFAGQYIRAGTELTWDYNYEVGSVPDKVLYCYCGSATCRGRLL
ncbi:Histone-lysine N-methyltransferase SETDB1-B [Bulinus truncatus]|nr:Histone-lysine N-methyltransferase SETDB1-B [Bulinus truncatus]